MQNLRRWLTSVRHTRSEQLLARARLTVKRRALVALERVLRRRRAWSAGQLPAVAKRLPMPLFAPRMQLVVEEEQELCLAFLHLRHPLRFPIDWHPHAWVQKPKLAAIHLHGMEWLEALDDERFQLAVHDWSARVPPYQPGYWRDTWNAFTLSIRVVVWMQQLARRGRRLDLACVDRATASIVEQVRFLASNVEHDIRGNHILKNIKALLWAGRFFEGVEALRWTELGEALLARELGEQFLADGMHFERSPAYHAQVCADLLECRHVLRPSPLATRVDETLRLALQALSDLTHPDGSVSLFNDGGLDMAYSTAEIGEAYTRLGGQMPPARAQVALHSAGYFGHRSKKSLLLVDCGAIAPDTLPAHGHGDALSFEWTLHGERLIVDAGVFEYDPGEMRAWSRSSAAHNTVTVGGEDQCEFYSSFRMARRARVELLRYTALDDGFVLQGRHDGFTHLPGRPLHKRLLRYIGNELLIEDRIDGGTGQAALARLLLHPSTRINAHSEHLLVLTQGRSIVEIHSDRPMELVDAWWCPEFGLKIRTRQIVMRLGNAPCIGSMRLVASVSLGSAPVGVRRVMTDVVA